MKKIALLVSGAFFAAVAGASDWSEKVVAFSATRDGAAVPPGETLASGDELSIVLTPPDEPESLGLSFSTAERSPKARGRRNVFEFDGQPVRLVKDRDANVWRTAFKVPFADKATEFAKGDFGVGVLRYGADTHFDGQELFKVPYAFRLAQGANAAAQTALKVYDFGPDDSALYRGAIRVSPKSTPEGFKWLVKPPRWEKAQFTNLDALMHDWAACDGGKRPIRFKLDLPVGKWKVAAGFGGFGMMCWLNWAYQPPCFEFSANGRVVFARTDDEKTRFRYREHEAEPGEDVYSTYIQPVLPETVFEVTSDGKGVTFEMTCPNENKKMAIDYLAVWPADDAEAAGRFDDILAKRRMRCESIAKEWPAADHYGLGSAKRYAEERARIAKDVPYLAAVNNPYDWVVPTIAPTSSEKTLTVKAAKGEKTVGGFVYRSDNDAPAVFAVARGFPPWAHAKVWKVMNYRFTNGYAYRHQITTNHLMEGPRPVKAGLNYMWYVRFDLPEDAPAGTYCGEVEVWEGARKMALPAELVVYDVNLPKLDDYRIGLMGAGDGSPEQMYFAKNELAATTVHICNGRLNGAKMIRDKDGKIVGCKDIGWCTVEDLDRRFKAYKKMDFPCKVPYCGPSCGGHAGGAFPIEGMVAFTPEWTEALRVVLKTVLAVARSNGCESVSMDLGGEIGHDAHRPNPKTVENVVRYMKLAKELEPGIEYTWRCNCMDSTTNFYPFLDYACIRGRSWGWIDQESDFGKNRRIGTYSVGGRFLNGLAAWYHGSKGSFREWVAWGHALEFNEFLCQGACGCAGHIEGMLGPKSEGGFTLTQRGEAWRAGIDDIRYMKLLEEAMVVAPDGATKAAAESFRSWTRDAVRNSLKFGRFCALGGPGRGDGGNDWPYLRMDIVREACVRYVYALRDGKTADLPAFPALPEQDTTTWLALDDGPLGYAGENRIDGQVRVPNGVKLATTTLALSGEGIEPVAVKLVPQGLRQRQLYYIPSGKPYIFTIDASGLKPGTYDLTFKAGDVEAVSKLTLVDRR